MGDFHIDLLNMNFQIQSIVLLIHLVRTFYDLNILLPTSISKTSTLIDNVFSNSTSLEEIESGNVTSAFPDDLLFMFLKDFFSKLPEAKSNIFSKMQYFKA